MKTKTFKNVYAGALIFIGIVVIGMVAVNVYGDPICDYRLNFGKTETIGFPTGEYYDLQNFDTFMLDAIAPPTVVYLMFVFFAGLGVFWFKEKDNKKKVNE